jgi:hypothetical protein
VTNFSTEPFERELRAVLAATSDAEAALATAARIQDGDPDSWLREWTAGGGDAWATARATPSAALYLDAAAYYGAALALIADTDGSVDERALWERQRECWERAVLLLGGTALLIPYERTTLPGFFFPATDEPRPLLVIDPGGRVPTSHALARAGAAAHAAGLHWMTFDGPGRQASLIRQRLALRPDWEAVLTPVADAMLARADVSGLYALGLEHAGYGITRALAFEHRFTAAAIEPGILDASIPWLDELPPAARDALLDEEPTAFEREMHLAGLFDPATNRLLRRRGRWYDDGKLSLYDLYQRIRTFRLGDELERITTPLLVCGGAEEPFWPGQADDMFARLTGPKTRADRFDPFPWLRRCT